MFALTKAVAAIRANGAGKATHIIFKHNSYFNTADILKSANDNVSDPLFVNTNINPIDANFQLKAGIPAIDAALAGQFPVTDITGKARLLGKEVNIGAYESR